MSSPATIELHRADATAASDEGAAPVSKPAPYGAKHMNSRIDSRKKNLKPRSLEPKHPPIYPVYPRAVPAGVKDSAMRVHPKGFRMLSKNSPLERNMVSYFRLPAQAPKHQAQEQDALRRRVDKELRQTGSNAAGAEGLVLDGFMMLDATGVRDPADATALTVSDSNVVGAVAEDLSYFVNVTVADLGENSLTLADLTPLVGLEALHLHCNCLGDLNGIAPGSFPKLHTLNLSFNQLRPDHLAALCALPLLERLDLSCNALGDIPAEFSQLQSLRQLALENNHLSKPKRLMRVLGKLPLLEEVNLNYNKLSSIPSINALLREEQELDDAKRAERLSPNTNNKQRNGGGDGDGEAEDPDMEQGGDDDYNNGTDMPLSALFPRLTVLGMGANGFVYFEDLFNLIEFPALEQVVLWGNPIESRRKDAEVLTFEMDQRGIAVILDSPVPGKKKAGTFIAEAKPGFVKVPAVDGRGLPRGHKIRTTTKKAKDEVPVQQDGAGDEGGEDGGSFFMTQAPGGPSSSTPSAAPGAASATPGTGAGRAPGSAQPSNLHQSYNESNLNGGATAGASTMPTHRPTRVGRAGTAGSAASGFSSHGRSVPSPIVGDGGDWDDGGTPADVGLGGGMSLQDRLRASAAQVDATATRRQGNIRTVMSQLRTMLRQPLPPLNRPRFAAKTKKGDDHDQQADSSSNDDDDDAGLAPPGML